MVKFGRVYWSVKPGHIWSNVLPKWPFVRCLCHDHLQFSVDSTSLACVLLSPCLDCITDFSHLLCRLTLLWWVSSFAWCDHWLNTGRNDKLLCILLRYSTRCQRATAKNKWIEFTLVFLSSITCNLCSDFRLVSDIVLCQINGHLFFWLLFLKYY